MSMSYNLGDVIAHVKNLVDSTRCTVCDKADGGRMRYVCGHTSCDDCLVGNEGCMLCLTPPNSASKPKADRILSQRVHNACDLLNVCQDTFNLDVYRSLRVSEQLRAEKELFPECIQAPVKYCNKRKSVTAISNKENSHNFSHPGEHISHTDSFMMKKCNNLVQKWLDSSASYPRKPFADLNVNKYNNTSNKRLQQKFDKRGQKEGNKTYINKDIFDVSQRKRPHSTSFSHVEKSSSVLKNKKFKKSVSPKIKIINVTNDDESGIVLDDEPILIEDSQIEIVDKDELALLAVQAAEQRQSNLLSHTLESRQDIDFLPPVFICKKSCDKDTFNKVPYYKKASLANSCYYCKEDHKLIKDYNNDSNNLAITIENQHFVTTISIAKCAKTVSGKQSVFVQTDFDDQDQLLNKEKECLTINETSEFRELTSNYIANNLDILRPQGSKNVHENKKGGITIDDSDSDESFLEKSLEVTADVHKSCEPLDYGILSEISTNALTTRARNKARAVTPDSNNSSDKENCDPNKRKKQKYGKKTKCAKK